MGNENSSIIKLVDKMEQLDNSAAPFTNNDIPNILLCQGYVATLSADAQFVYGTSNTLFSKLLSPEKAFSCSFILDASSVTIIALNILKNNNLTTVLNA